MLSPNQESCITIKKPTSNIPYNGSRKPKTHLWRLYTQITVNSPLGYQNMKTQH